jgi:uncharacterized protein (TIGR04222 family)
MNPLDLTGPEFLRFYVPYGACIAALAWLIRALLDRAPGPQPAARWLPGTYPREGDAHAIAFLRGGAQEAVWTVLGRLMALGLVSVESDLVRTEPESSEGIPQLQPMEKAAWSALRPGVSLSARNAAQHIRDAIGPHLHGIEEELAREGLLPTSERRTAFRALRVLAWLAVVGFGLLKLGVAFSRGKSNVGFLILLLIGFHLLIVRLLRPPRGTQAGRQYLDWLKESHRGLVRMLDSGRRDSPGELALAAGIYGLTAVPVLAPLGLALQPAPVNKRKEGDASSSSSSSGCGGGSSCSSGSSCGGGCGGGGCGGCGG